MLIVIAVANAQIDKNQSPAAIEVKKNKSDELIEFQSPCKNKKDYTFFTISGGEKLGKIVSIDQCDGHVIVYHPEKMDESAQEFWRTIQRIWPLLCQPMESDNNRGNGSTVPSTGGAGLPGKMPIGNRGGNGSQYIQENK